MGKDAKIVYVENKDSNQTVQMCRLTCLHWMHMSDGMFSHVAAKNISDTTSYLELWNTELGQCNQIYKSITVFLQKLNWPKIQGRVNKKTN